MPHHRVSRVETAATTLHVGTLTPSGSDWCRANFRVPADDRAASAARRYTRVWLEEIQDVEDDEACGNLLLIVSELVTNAVVHTGSAWVTCYLWVAADLLHVEVQDQGGRLACPRVQAAADDDEHGRGLLLVQALARSWGVVPDPSEGRSVWAAVPFVAGGGPGGSGRRLV